MHKGFLKTAALLGALSVILGAFGAHGLKKVVADANVLQVYETAVRYQFYHVFALLFAGILYKQFPGTMMQWAGRLFIAGTIIFSGSLYILTWLKASGTEGYNWVGAITPIGGVLFIIGWLCLFISFSKSTAVN